MRMAPRLRTGAATLRPSYLVAGISTAMAGPLIRVTSMSPHPLYVGSALRRSCSRIKPSCYAARCALRTWPYSQRKAIAKVWIRDFFHVRNSFGHGRKRQDKESVWTPRSHLLLGSYLFPLALVVRLAEERFCSLTDADRKALFAFPYLACLRHPPGHRRGAAFSPSSYACNYALKAADGAAPRAASDDSRNRARATASDVGRILGDVAPDRDEEIARDPAVMRKASSILGAAKEDELAVAAPPCRGFQYLDPFERRGVKSDDSAVGGRRALQCDALDAPGALPCH